MRNSYSIAILMSTYNGEQFLEEQVLSIMEQVNVDLHLFIRDDGSSDGTCQLLNKMKMQYVDKMTLIFGENLGYAKSYFELMKLPQLLQFEYIAFADQDDTWGIDKLAILAKKLFNNKVGPQLALSNGNVTVHSKKVGKLYDKTPVTQSLVSVRYRAFYGMSFMFNNALLNVILHSDIDNICDLGHDDWTMMVAVSTGKISYIDHSLINYRQHSNNASGVKNGTKPVATMSKIIQVSMNLKQRLKHWQFKNSTNADYVLKHVPEKYILDEQLMFLRNLIGANNHISYRLSLLFSKKLSVGSVTQNIILRFLLILKRI